MRLTTRNSYADRIQRVLSDMAARLDEPLTTAELAGRAALSPFHFQRVFLAMTGESVGEVLRRLRLARACWALRSEGKSVTEIALDAGYGSVEGFSRAFRRATGLAPSTYRTIYSPPPMKPSNIRIDYCPEAGTVRYIHLEGDHRMKVTIETLPWRQALCARQIGSYDDIPKAYERLEAWAADAGIDLQGKTCFGLAYDDPESDDPAALRYDACVEVELPPDMALPDDIRADSVAGGRYAVHEYAGSYAGLSDAFQRLFGLWLPASGEEPDDRPCVELYLNTLGQVPERDLRTKICLPLKER